jgi:hypothetical protein
MRAARAVVCGDSTPTWMGRRGCAGRGAIGASERKTETPFPVT